MADSRDGGALDESPEFRVVGTFRKGTKPGTLDVTLDAGDEPIIPKPSRD